MIIMHKVSASGLVNLTLWLNLQCSLLHFPVMTTMTHPSSLTKLLRTLIDHNVPFDCFTSEMTFFTSTFPLMAAFVYSHWILRSLW